MERGSWATATSGTTRGSDPSGPIKHDKLSGMINRGINASAAMLILNPNAATNYQVGIENSRFSCGSVHYACREVRAANHE